MVVLGMRVVWVMSIVDWSIWVHWWTGFRLNFRPPAVSHVNFIQIREREREREGEILWKIFVALCKFRELDSTASSNVRLGCVAS